MAKSPPSALIQLRRIDDDAYDGKYQFLADEQLFALARWDSSNLRWTYPGGAPLDFDPLYYRPASKAMHPQNEVGHG